MLKRASTLLAMSLLVTFGFAKDKAKSALPGDVLSAQTVAVLIDPNAGLSVDDRQANQVAQKDVETALLNWGRFQPVLGTQTADLIVVLRKGNGRLVNQTIPDPRQNNRAGVITPADNGVSIGAQHGPRPNLSGGPVLGSGPPSPHSQTEVGEVDDSFLVYRGGVEDPLDSTPVWKYIAKDGLRPHNVPAVAAFRKAVAEADKAAACKP
ncbi:MAG TPA: hypothetical protein VGR96_19570 [Acidobacteriaceae bacterium]|nr:hypothetical protein [Acidobacteriaceae bacterium]